MMEIYMLCQDEELYTELKKKSLGVEVVKEMLIQGTDSREINDYIFMKLGTAYDIDGKPMDGNETLEAYVRNCHENGLGYTWFSTKSLHYGMAEKKVAYYNSLCQSGEKVKILFAIGENVNDVIYAATVLEIASDGDGQRCPGDVCSEPEEFANGEPSKIWIKITDIAEENTIKAAMLRVRTTGANVKQVISNSQWHFGYVYIPEEE